MQPWRRAAHLVTGSGVAWIVYALGPQSSPTRWLFGTMLLIAFTGDLLRLRTEAFNRFVFRTFSALMCPREIDRPSLTWFLLGVFLVLWLPDPSLVVPALLVLAVADPAASVVGRLVGTHPVGKGSLEGTAAFFVAAVAVLTPFAGVWAALLTAAVVATVEVVPTRLDDNLLIPVVTAACLWTISGVG